MATNDVWGARADQVGSLLRPDRLIAARDKANAGQLEAASSARWRTTPFGKLNPLGIWHAQLRASLSGRGAINLEPLKGRDGQKKVPGVFSFSAATKLAGIAPHRLNL